eukprot:TRINITY_DN6833_c0_g1_i1.p3 TRINITY_DN6833_c0_g1~~TRINITY_DN6833_c0_g1_i1.p3  ORF type:complete len:102 (-),score=38.59 TRINITY_DN6833_c0_g1_i1:138-443(-)
MFASEGTNPVTTKVNWDAWASKNIETKYFNPGVSVTSFLLPEFLVEVLQDAETKVPSVWQVPRYMPGIRPKELHDYKIAMRGKERLKVMHKLKTPGKAPGK